MLIRFVYSMDITYLGPVSEMVENSEKSLGPDKV